MKKLYQILLVLALSLLISGSALAAGAITVFVNDLEIIPDVPPYISQNRTMLPARAILEPLGCQFQWDGASNTVTISRGSQEVRLVIGEGAATVDGVLYPLEAPAVIQGSRTFLPLRFVAENFNATVAWDGAARTIRVTSDSPDRDRDTGDFADRGGSPRQAMMVTGYYFDANSLTSLSENLDLIDDTIHFSYRLGMTGRIEEKPFFNQGFELAKANGQKVEMLVFASDRTQLKAFLNDSAAQAVVITDIVNHLRNRGFDGVNLDFELIDPGQGSQYLAFVEALKSNLGGGYTLSLSIPARTSDRETWYDGYDYAGLARVADRVMVMAYDQHYKGGEPGPVAGNDWVERVITYLLPKIPADKFQLGMGIYGYDWPEEAKGKTILLPAARDLAAAKGIEILQDSDSGVSHFEYLDDSGIPHQVWFEDAPSVRAKMELVNKYQLRGIALWRLGIIPQDIWHAIREGQAAYGH